MVGWKRRNALAALLLISAPACALEIETRFYAPGETIPALGAARAQPFSAVGDGDLESIVRAAADTWESLIADDHHLLLNFGWYPTTGFSNSAFHVPISFGGIPLRQTAGSIAFNSDLNTISMYLDPTPGINDEFELARRDWYQAETTPIEYARWYTATNDSASVRNDVYTAALHEIGHALGFTQSSAFLKETSDNDIDLWDQPYAGSSLPTVGTHLDLDGPLMSQQPRNLGERRGITQADLLSVCQINGFTECRYDLTSPEAAVDLNDNGIVDAADYTVLRDASTTGEATGDVNADGVIDDTDFDLWRSLYGSPTGEPLDAVVIQTPEPNALALIAAVAMGLSAGAARRGLR